MYAQGCQESVTRARLHAVTRDRDCERAVLEAERSAKEAMKQLTCEETSTSDGTDVKHQQLLATRRRFSQNALTVETTLPAPKRVRSLEYTVVETQPTTVPAWCNSRWTQGSSMKSVALMWTRRCMGILKQTPLYEVLKQPAWLKSIAVDPA